MAGIERERQMGQNLMSSVRRKMIENCKGISIMCRMKQEKLFQDFLSATAREQWVNLTSETTILYVW